MRAAGRLLVPLVALLAGAATADELGRLFFTPAERARLDAERSAPLLAPPLAEGGASAEPPPSVVPQDETPLAPPSPITVDGLVLRAHGPSTAWVNGTPGTRRDLMVEGAAAGGRELRIGRDAVEIDDAQARAWVKPGQTFDPVAGRVVENFERSDGAPAADAP